MKKHDNIDRFIVRDIKDMVDLFNEGESRTWARYETIRKSVHNISFRQAIIAVEVLVLAYDVYKLHGKVSELEEGSK